MFADAFSLILMDYKFVSLACFLLLLGATAGYVYAFEEKKVSGSFSFAPQCAYSVEPVFSPGAGGELFPFIASARESIDLEVFQFSSVDLKKALFDARERGVRVRVILDLKVNGNLETARDLKGKGIEVRWASVERFNYTHSKYAVVDGRKVLVGSINWSYNALKRNREAGVIIESAEVAQKFSGVFETDWKNSAEVK